MTEKPNPDVIPFPGSPESVYASVGHNHDEEKIIPFQTYDAQFDEHITNEQRLYYKTSIEKLRVIFKKLIGFIAEAEILLEEIREFSSKDRKIFKMGDWLKQKQILLDKYRDLSHRRSVSLKEELENEAYALELEKLSDIFKNSDGESIRDLIDDFIDELQECLDNMDDIINSVN